VRSDCLRTGLDADEREFPPAKRKGEKKLLALAVRTMRGRARKKAESDRRKGLVAELIQRETTVRLDWMGERSSCS